MPSPTIPHPLDPLSSVESNVTRQAILDARGSNVTVRFRSIFLEEPPKAELVTFLALEHSGQLTAASPRPARVARVQYDAINSSKEYSYVESLVDVNKRTEVKERIVDKLHQAGIIMYVSLSHLRNRGRWKVIACKSSAIESLD